MQDDCVIVPKSEMVINQQVRVVFSNSYIKDIDDEINIDNTSLLNPYEYYFNTSNKTRLPIQIFIVVHIQKDLLLIKYQIQISN